MGSLTFDGIRFQVYSLDHLPPHVHGFYGSTQLVVEFGDPEAIGIRRDSILPPNAKRRDVRRILDSAVENYLELIALWEETHGPIER